MDDREFYKLFGDEVIITTLPDRKHFRVPADEVYDRVVELGKSRNVYINPNTRRADLPPHLRGEDDDVETLIAFVADIDIHGPAHKETELPPDKAAAMAFLDDMKIKPTGFVDSGYGIYGYYLFKEPVSLTNDDIRERAKGLLRGFGKHAWSRIPEFSFLAKARWLPLRRKSMWTS